MACNKWPCRCIESNSNMHKISAPDKQNPMEIRELSFGRQITSIKETIPKSTNEIEMAQKNRRNLHSPIFFREEQNRTNRKENCEKVVPAVHVVFQVENPCIEARTRFAEQHAWNGGKLRQNRTLHLDRLREVTDIVLDVLMLNSVSCKTLFNKVL